MIINHNIAALNTYRQLSANNVLANKSLEKLSSGLRIVRAGDDAAGLAISEKMRGQIRGLNQAVRNSQDAISLIQTAEGALNETHSILQRMRELAVQAANDTLIDNDRAEIQKEINQLADEIDRIATTTEFNTKKLVDGSLSADAKSGYFTNVSGNAAAGIEVKSYAQIGTQTVYVVTSSVGAAQGTVTDSKQFRIGSAAQTPATGSAALSALKDSAGNSLGLTNGDVITISMKIGGELYTAKYVISDASTETYQSLIDTINTEIFNGGTRGTASIDTTDGSIKLTGIAGRDNAITEVSITAKSSAGASRTYFDAAATFTQTQVAANQGDVILNVGTSSAADTINNTAVAVAKGGTISTLIDGVTIKLANTTYNNTDEFTVTVSKSDQSLSMHIGANEDQTISVSINDIGARALGVRSADNRAVLVGTAELAEQAITTIDNAIVTVSAERSKLGAYQNRLEHTINNLGTAAENLTAAESRIRDIDMAKEMMEYTKLSILQQAATAMLSQANQQPQLVLQLLR